MARYVGLRAKLVATAVSVMLVSGVLAWGVFVGFGVTAWQAIALSTAIGVAIAVIISEISARWITSEMNDLVKVVRVLGGRPAPGEVIDEPVSERDTRVLVGSFKRLSDALETSMAELAEAQDRFSAVVERIDEGLLSCDSDGRVTMANASARRLLFGREGERGAIEGTPLLELVRVPVITELLSMARSESREFEIPGPPRRSLVALAHPNVDGSRVIVVRDVTPLRRLETMRRDFVSNVSHELRTPISVILANAETLVDGALDHPEQAKRFCQAIARNAERLGGLVEELLDLNRIETGQQRIDLVPLSMKEAVERAVGTLGPKAETQGVTLVVDIRGEGEGGKAPGRPICAIGDRRAVDQILVNLIDNAIKYGGGGTVCVSAAAADGAVTIRVSDNGPGIDPTHRGRVFERFYRVDPGRARHMGGKGLGLAIVKHLVESMGGDVGVEGARPRGSIFWFRLPQSLEDA